MPEFSVVLRGYNRHQVDVLVSQVEGTLGRGPLAGEPIDLKRFGWVEFDVAFRGYDRFEVDGAMRRYHRELAEHEGVELPAMEHLDSGLSLVLGDPPGEAPRHYSVIEQIRREHAFPLRMRGYDRGQVDAIVARLWATLGRPAGDGQVVTLAELGPAVTRHELNHLELTVVARGYDRREVDQALGRYLRELLDLQDETHR